MFAKLIGVIVATIIIAAIPGASGYAIPFFFLGTVVVFVIEGVRLVPQQNAWVVERMGNFMACWSRA